MVRIPVLPGEKVVSSGRTVVGGEIEVRLAPGADSASWEGELAPVDRLTLTAAGQAGWVEQWRLVASSVWNVTFSGLPPVYLAEEGQLVPFWQPWPDESATLEVSRPVAVPGATVTVDSVTHTLSPGRRQRSSKLELSLRASLGEDFPITLPSGAEVTSLVHSGTEIPIRKEGDRVIVPLKPGGQSIEVGWNHAGAAGGWTRSAPVTLPVEAANVSTKIRPPDGRWVILTDGPLRGPAVRFWGVLAFAILAAFVLSRTPGSPLRFYAWALLALGLSQVPVVCSFFVVGWLFALEWRGSEAFQKLGSTKYNLYQAGLAVLTAIALGIFVVIASAGLLGSPEMYIAGNSSSARLFDWFSARSGPELPRPGYWSVSIWWFRLAVLFWALWLSASLVGWIRRGWKHAGQGGFFRGVSKKEKADSPPPIPGK